MAKRVEEQNIVIRTRSEGVSKTFDNVSKATTSLTNRLKYLSKQSQEIAYRTTGVSLAVAGLGHSVITSFTDYQSSMNRAIAVSGALGDEIDQLHATARNLGLQTQFSAKAAAEGMVFLAQAGQKTNEIVEVLPKTLKLAAAAQIDLASASDIVTNVMAGYGVTVDGLQTAVDSLTVAFTSANTDLQQLGVAFRYAGPVAKSAGIDFHEAGAALALMGNAGIQASMAGTALRGSITRILNPTKMVREALDEVGVSLVDGQGNIRSLTDIIRKLEPHADNASLLMRVFGQRAGPAMAALIGQGSEALIDLTYRMENSAGVSDRIAKTMVTGLFGVVVRLTSAIKGVAIEIGEAFEPQLIAVGEALTGVALFMKNSVIPAFDALPDFVKEGTLAFIGLTAATSPLFFGASGVLAIAQFVLQGLGLSFGQLTAKVRLTIKLLTALRPLLSIGLIVGGSVVAVKLLDDAVVSASQRYKEWGEQIEKNDAKLKHFGSVAKLNATQLTNFSAELKELKRQVAEYDEATSEGSADVLIDRITELEMRRQKAANIRNSLIRRQSTFIDELRNLENELVEDFASKYNVLWFDVDNWFAASLRYITGIGSTAEEQINNVRQQLEEARDVMNELSFEGYGEDAPEDLELDAMMWGEWEDYEAERLRISEEYADRRRALAERAAQEEADNRKAAIEKAQEEARKSLQTTFGIFKSELSASSESIKALSADTRLLWRDNADGLALLTGMQEAYATIGRSELEAAEKVERFLSALASGNRAVFDELLRDFIKTARAAEVVNEALEEANDYAEQFAKELLEKTNELIGSMQDLSEITVDAFDASAIEPILFQLRELGHLTIDQENAYRNMAREIQSVDWRRLEEDALAYGVATEKTKDLILGAAYAQGKLTEEGHKLGQAFDNFIEHGVKAGFVIHGLRDEAQGFVTSALRMGLDVPRSMEPMLQSMVQAGVLLDENGQRLQDLSRIKFSDTLEQQFQNLIDALWALVEQMKGTLPGAIEDATGKLQGFEGVGQLAGSAANQLTGEVDNLGATAGLTAEEMALLTQDTDDNTKKTIRAREEYSKSSTILRALAGNVSGVSSKALNFTAQMLETNAAIKDQNKDLTDAQLKLKLAEDGFSTANIAVGLLGVGLGLLGESIEGAAGELLSIGADAAAAFAVGGPLGAAIAGISGLIGFFKKRNNEAREEIKKFQDRVNSLLQDIINGSVSAKDAIDIITNFEGDKGAWDEQQNIIQTFKDAGRSAEEAADYIERYTQAVNDYKYGMLSAEEAQANLNAVVKEGAEIAREARTATLQKEWLGIPSDEDIDRLWDTIHAYAALNEEDKKQARPHFAKALHDAREAGVMLSPVLHDIADEYLALQTGEALGIIPSQSDLDKFNDMVRGWEKLDPAQQAAGAKEYAKYLRDAAESGIALTDAQKEFLRLNPDWEQMEELAKEYGISIDALGAKFHALRSIDVGKQLASDFKTLVDGGADVVSVLGSIGKEGTGMANAINEYFQTALRHGAAIPDAMRPVLQAMADQGLLIGENGQKIEDISDIRFDEVKADPLERVADATDGIVIGIGALVEALGGDVPAALQVLIDQATGKLTGDDASLEQQIKDNEQAANDLQKQFDLLKAPDLDINLKIDPPIRKLQDDIDNITGREGDDAITLGFEQRVNPAVDDIAEYMNERIAAIKGRVGPDAIKLEFDAEFEVLNNDLERIWKRVLDLGNDAEKAEEKFKDLIKGVDLLGINLADLHEGLNFASLKEQVGNVIEAFDALEGIGVSSLDAIAGMSDDAVMQIGDLILAAQRAGVEIPDHLKPILDRYNELIAVKEALYQIDNIIEATKRARDIELDAIDDKIRATERARDRALAAIDETIKGVEREKKETLEAYDSKIKVAELYKKHQLGLIDDRIKEANRAKQLELRAIDDRIKAIQRAKDEELKAIDATIKAVENSRDITLAAIDEQIKQTERMRDAQLESIDQQIQATKELRDEKLALLDIEIERAKADVHDVGTTQSLVKKFDLEGLAGQATKFQTQKASDEILQLAKDVAQLQDAGFDLTAALTGKFGDELKTAVEAARKYGIAIPESLRDIISKFDALRGLVIQYGDGLTAEARLVEDLTEQRKQREQEYLSIITELQDRRKTIEQHFVDSITSIKEYRVETEQSYAEQIDQLKNNRVAIEQAYSDQIDAVKLAREQAERNYTDLVYSLKEERENLERLLTDRIDTIKADRDRVERDFNERLQDLRDERDTLEREYNIKLQELRDHRLETENYYNQVISDLQYYRQLVETEGVSALGWINQNRDLAENSIISNLNFRSNERDEVESRLTNNLSRLAGAIGNQGFDQIYRGAASGGLFSKPTFRVIAERGPEVVGSPEPLVRAFMSALERYDSGGSDGRGGGDIIIVTADELMSGASDKISPGQMQHIQRALHSGSLTVPGRAVGDRIR